MKKMINDKLTIADQGKFQLAQEYSLAGEFDKMVDAIQELVASYPTMSILRGALANGLWELDEFDRAIQEFGIAIQYSPSSEKLSLGLFHCLWSVGRVDDAFSEMNRFLSKYDSEDYRAILQEIDDKSS